MLYAMGTCVYSGIPRPSEWAFMQDARTVLPEAYAIVSIISVVI